jgi:hypothetical protein
MWGQQIAMPDFTRGHSLNPHPSDPHLGVMAPPYASSAALCSPLLPPDPSMPPPPQKQNSSLGLGELGAIPVFQSGEMVGRQHSIGALSDLLMGDFELSIDTDDGGNSRAASLGTLDDLSNFEPQHEQDS